MRPIILNAHSKVNLHLAVGGRLPNALHNIESIFTTLSLHDTLEIRFGDEENAVDDVSMNASALPPLFAAPLEALPREKNIVCAALRLFRAKTGFKRDVSIAVRKRVPSGAGLGGGSADAAAVLRALFSVLPDGGFAELETMAAELGSDVPFFLRGGAALVEGFGERILPIDGRTLHFVVVTPEFSSDTGRAYRLLDQFREKNGPSTYKPFDFLIPAFYGEIGRWPFFNDFLPVFMEAGSAEEREGYGAILGALRETGALFCGLSGSGSACFGVFSSREAALKAEAALSRGFIFARAAFSVTQAGTWGGK
ncbi:MAG: 4-(cytidine 5'-diphospho)-2-C-methyl-D-erythritol kinase [Spirochaetaceae bacterium]|jgi:4-diphosphocytidyl-2-C-methyl-D-erythritol kinase|nr:4-(cytidine 5'-diphospho)-2-C-methyl-D-erythritol kinase [Spirochaetaceae bacterium]